MVMELIKRWKCSECGYITFKQHRECPMCSYGTDMMEDLRQYGKKKKKQKKVDS